MVEKNKRIVWIDVAKFFAISLVILGHINVSNSHIVNFIYSFHMPLFLFLSGCVYTVKNNDLKNYILINIKKLIIPYFIWSTIFCDFMPKNLFYVLYGSHQSLKIAESISSYWYLPMFFVSIILMYFLIRLSTKVKKSKTFLLIVSIILFFISLIIPKFKIGYPFSLDTIFISMPFIILGFISKDKLQNIYNKNNSIKFVLLFLISFIIVLMGSKYLNCKVLLAENNVYNPFIFSITSIFGIIMVISLAFIIEQINIKWFLNKICFIGQNTITIFLTNNVIISLISQIYNWNLLPWFLSLGIIFIIVLIIEFIVIKFVDNFIPQIVGKKV